MIEARRAVRWSLVMVALVSLAPVATARAASFTGIGFLPGGDVSRADDVSREGRVVSASSEGPFPGSISAARFDVLGTGGTLSQPITSYPGIGAVPGIGLGHARSSSLADVEYATGLLFVPPIVARGWYWRRDGGSSTTVVLSDFPSPGANTVAWAVSETGRVVVEGDVAGTVTPGYRDIESASPAIVPLPMAGGRDISSDGDRIVGSVEVGTSTHAAYHDVTSASTIDLGTLAGGNNSLAYGVSSLGTMVVGASESTATGGSASEAFRWHADFGMHALEPIWVGARESQANAVSDGGVVVGKYRADGGVDRAFIWKPRLGRVDLKTHLESVYGLDLTGWTLLEAKSISGDGQVIAGHGENPDGDTEGWVARLSDPDPFVLSLVPVKPNDSPAVFELRASCGEFGAVQIDVGIVLPASFDTGSPEDFDFGGCDDITTPPYRSFCTGALDLGPTVSEMSYYDGPAPDLDMGPGTRVDTAYLRLFGIGPSTGEEICLPGAEDVYLGRVTLPERNPELVASLAAQSTVVGLDKSLVPERYVRLERRADDGSKPPPPTFGLRPRLDDTNGTELELYVDPKQVDWSKLSVGVILPPDVTDAIFGDCTIQAFSFNGRRCGSNEFLGSLVDHTTVRTLGPHPALPDLCGLRADTLYIFAAGQGGSGQVNPKLAVAGRQNILGRVKTAQASSLGGRDLTVTLEELGLLNSCWSDFEQWEETDGTTHSTTAFLIAGGGGHDGGSGSDTDMDTIVDTDDNCWELPNFDQDDEGTINSDEADGIGNVCQCLEMNTDHIVLQADIDTMRDVFLGRLPPSAMADSTLCNGVGPVATMDGPIPGLPLDCNLNDVYVAMRALLDLKPVVPDPGVHPVCPDSTTP